MDNETRQAIEEVLDKAKTELAAKKRELQLKSEVIDVTLPSKRDELGHKHPNTLALEEIQKIFIGMGYEVVDGPEVEYDYYIFEALNIPANHPAKDEQEHSTSMIRYTPYTDFTCSGKSYGEGQAPYQNDFSWTSIQS